MTGVSIEYANCLEPRVGSHGLPAGWLNEQRPRLAQAIAQLNSERGTGWQRWRVLPFDPMRSEHIQQVRAACELIKGRCDNLVVLGIGGSALGNIALQASLNPMTWNHLPSEQRNGPRLFVLDNVDPNLIGETIALLGRLDPSLERTFINVISKSGETAETAAQFLLFRELLRDALGDAHRKHIIAITDPANGTMRAICDEAGYTTLPIPEGVGGRFSVLSPVGLFSSAMCGIDIDGLLDGAAAMDERCQSETIEENPAAVLASLLVELTQRGKRCHVMMPYCNRLTMLADWFAQLWAESLGKRVDNNGREVFAGATPIRALGATDQHSQVQLYREGPNDKVIMFIEVEQFDEGVTIPAAPGVDALDYLGGATMGTLLASEKRATEYALVESQRPNLTIRLPRLSAHSIGEFMQLWMIATACAGKLLNINAFDQPAVETGKVATFGLMGRAGYEQWRHRVDQTLSPSNAIV